MYSHLLSQAMDVDAILPSTPSSVLSEQIRQRWLEALGLSEPEKLDRRLLWDNLAPAKLNAILTDVVEGECSNLGLEQSVDSTEIPWMIALGKICKAIRTAEAQSLQEPGDDTTHFEVSQLPFYHLWQPAVEWAVLELRRRLDPLINVQINGRVLADLGYYLLIRFCFIGEHVLWELFNTERGVGAALLAYIGSKGTRSAPPARKHYQLFIQRHQRDGLTSLLRQFPVLGRLLGNVLIFWLDSSEEMLLRVYKDRKSLQDIFDIPMDAALSSVHQGLSDHHGRGRTVAVLTFRDNGSNWKVVYKPRDMGVDAAYQQVLVELNGSSGFPPLMTLKILKQQGYGYMEFLQHQLCEDQQELERFYHNAGRLSAILYMLGCTDCHHENLIARGDQLVLIDTETLLEPTIVNHISQVSNSHSPKPISDLQKKFEDSILRSGLIHSWLFVGVQKYAVDMSALGIDPPAVEYELVTGWVNVNSDEMLRGSVKRFTHLPTSLPVGIGKANPLLQHIEHFVEGFREQSLILIQRRSDWLRRGGLFDCFVGLPRRIVLRATRVYFSIQIQQLQAEALRSEFSQGMKLEQLARLFLMAEVRPKNWPIFAAEMHQMERFDIPYFIHQIDNNQLPLQDGISAIDNFFETSGLQASRCRLEAFDDDVIEFQIRLIRGAVQAKKLRAHCNLLQEVSTQPYANSLELSAPQRLHEAQNIAKKLVALSFDNGHGKPEWIGLDLANDCDKLLFRPLGTSLYSGSIGIAAFFACLIKSQTQWDKSAWVEELGRIMQGLLRPLTELADETGSGGLLRWWRDQPMGLGGSAGQLLTLIAMDEVGVTLDSFKSGYELACQLLEGLRESYIINAPALDLISGVTGLIGPLLLLNTAKSVRLAKLIGDRLVETQEKSGGWGGSDSKSTLSLLGFSHGVAGVVATLAQLYRCTGILRYRDAVLKALVYERKQFHVEKDDCLASHLHGTENSKQLMDSWCHGSSGSALGKLCLMGTDLWDATVEQEVSLMLDTRGQKAFPVDHICCGSFGRIAILRLAYQRLKNEMWRVKSDQIEVSSLNGNLRRGGQFRLLDTQEASLIQPGFMNGLSGIGLVLLDNEYSQPMIRTLLSAGLLVEPPSGNASEA
jgi:type 2 lantibiotic biosynthesis protein LanM